MSPDTIEGTASLADVDFSELEEAPCEYPVVCNRSAEWAFVLECGCKVLVCEPHKHEEVARTRLWLGMWGPYDSTCNTCGAKRLITGIPRAERI